MLQIPPLYNSPFIVETCLINLSVRNPTTGKYAGGITEAHVRINK
jgi:hypothetical protein